MGVFESLTGIAGVSERAVVESLEQYFREQGAWLRDAEPEEEADRQLWIACSGEGRITIRGWSHSAEQDTITQHLSRALAAPAFHFHIHDGDLWMYELFANGQLQDRFNTVPDYWGELSPEEMASWRGRAPVVCEHWPDVREEQLAELLVWWDERTEADGWQLCEFMERLGLTLPEPDQARCLVVEEESCEPITTRMTLEQLVDALVDREERSERDRAVSILRGRDQQGAAQALLRMLLGERDPALLGGVTRAMADLALPEAVDDLLPCLESPDWPVRCHAGVALVRLGEREHAMPALEALLLDEQGPNAKQIRAALAIGSYGRPEQLELLERAARIHRCDPMIQEVIGIAIGQLGRAEE